MNKWNEDTKGILDNLKLHVLEIVHKSTHHFLDHHTTSEREQELINDFSEMLYDSIETIEAEND